MARAVVTPPVGSPLIGFAGRAESTACHDDLTATALVLECGGLQIAIVACDVLYIMGGQRTRAAIASRSGIHPGRILLTASHNHYGPPLDPDVEGAAHSISATDRSLVLAYLANLDNVLSGVVAAACSRLVPCSLGFATGNAFIGINRRERLPDGRIVLGNNPDGPCDRTVRLLRIDQPDGRPLVQLLNFACHAVTLGSECTEITADFPAVARELIERETGALCIFLQGAAGNINPVLMGWDWTYPRRLGLSLGAEGARLFWTAQPEPLGGGLNVTSTTVALPPFLPGSVQEAKDLIRCLEAEVAAPTTDAGSLAWAEWRLSRARRALDVVSGNKAPVPVKAELTAISLGSSIGWITSPGEVFTELGGRIVEQSPFERTLFSGYTHDAIGYVPTPTAYDEGGYEVTHSCYVARESAEILETRSLEMLARVHDQATGSPLIQ